MWLMHDPRVRLDDNSIDKPLADGKGFTSLLTDGKWLVSRVLSYTLTLTLTLTLNPNPNPKP